MWRIAMRIRGLNWGIGPVPADHTKTHDPFKRRILPGTLCLFIRMLSVWSSKRFDRASTCSSNILTYFCFVVKYIMWQHWLPFVAANIGHSQVFMRWLQLGSWSQCAVARVWGVQRSRQVQESRLRHLARMAGELHWPWMGFFYLPSYLAT